MKLVELTRLTTDWTTECPNGLGIRLLIGRPVFENWLDRINVCISHP